MSIKKRFLLRLDEDLYAMLEKWAADDLRSVNAQIEFLLAEAGKWEGRIRKGGAEPRGGAPPPDRP
jgi:hypothetical protein